MIDEKINLLFNENITFGNIFVESESLNIFTIVNCMPAMWEVSSNSVTMSSFSDAVNINKYSDLHFSYIFYRTKVRSLHCQYHSRTPRLNEKTDSGKSHLQDLARWWRTSQRVDIQKISQFYWALFEKTRFLCFYIIKSMARKGYFGPKSDFRGSKIPPRGASST